MESGEQNQMKKIKLLGVVLAMTLALSACGSTGGNSVTSQTNDSVAEETNTTESESKIESEAGRTNVRQ